VWYGILADQRAEGRQLPPPYLRALRLGGDAGRDVARALINRLRRVGQLAFGRAEVAGNDPTVASALEGDILLVGQAASLRVAVVGLARYHGVH